MHIEEKFNIKRMIIEIIGTIVGAFVMACGISLFLLPNQLSSGGVSGLATIIYYLFHIPMGRTIVGTVSLSVFIDILDQFPQLTDDRFLACIYGGIIIGLRNCNNFKSGVFYWR